MQITGNITAIGQLSTPKGTYQICYQDIEITGVTGSKMTGNIGSKKGYAAGTQITVEVTEDPQYGTKFKRIDPQYAGGGSQGGQRPNADPAKELSIKRQAIFKGVMSAATIASDMIGDYLIAGMAWEKTGTWNLTPPNFVPDDVPPDSFPDDEPIPF